MKSYNLLILLTVSFLLSSCKKDESPYNKKARWINNAFESLTSNRYPTIKAIAWWHENFDNSLLRIDSSPESLQAYQNGISSPVFVSKANFKAQKLITPVSGIYHAAFPDFGGTEDMVTTKKIHDFETLAGKNIVWACFSNNWYDNIRFPADAVRQVNLAGKIPYIRIMPRTSFNDGGPDPNYTMQNIIDGIFDTALIQWALDASNTHIPLLAEFGTEVNGNWFPWNGQYNGAGETTGYGDPFIADGPERFRDAYRHIINLCNSNGVNNITWFFHVDAYSEPTTEWNQFENYYPGDNYIDWLGVSVYGPQKTGDEYHELAEIVDGIYPRLTALSDKPIAVLEFAVTELK